MGRSGLASLLGYVFVSDLGRAGSAVIRRARAVRHQAALSGSRPTRSGLRFGNKAAFEFAWHFQTNERCANSRLPRLRDQRAYVANHVRRRAAIARWRMRDV